jgi:class 3 adenylate cyclase
MATPQEINRLKLLVEQTNDNKVKAGAIRKILESFSAGPQETEAYTAQLVQLSDAINEDAYRAWANLFSGRLSFEINNLDAAKELIDRAFSAFSAAGDLPGISSSYMIYGSIERAKKEYPAALEYYFKAAEIREETADGTLPHTYFEISLTCDATINATMAARYLQMALEIYEKEGDKVMLTRCYSNFGAMYYTSDKKLSLQYHLQALKVAEEISAQKSMSYSYYWIGALYIDTLEYILSVGYLEKAVKICLEISNKHILTYSYIALGRLRMLANGYPDAARYLEDAGKIIKEVPNTRWERALYKAWYELKKADGDTYAALDFYEKYVQLHQEIDSAEFTEKMAEVKFKIDIEKKEKEVEMEKKMRAIVEEKNLIIEAEKQKSDALLLNILPAEVAEELKEKGTAGAKLFDDVTVLFTDFKDFTKVAEQLSPQDLVDELHSCFSAFDGIMVKYKIEKIKTVGDAYLAVSGLPQARTSHAEEIVKAAIEIRDFMLNRKKIMGDKTFGVRIGIHSGSVVAGIVGVKKFAYDIWGDTVNTAARMEQNSEPGKINASQTTYELVKDKFTCEYRGQIEAKNKGKLKMYFIGR